MLLISTLIISKFWFLSREIAIRMANYELNLPHLKTYLSKSVAKMMTLAKTQMETSNLVLNDDSSRVSYFDIDYTLNENMLSQMYREIEADGVQLRSSEFYCAAIEKLSNLFLLSTDLLINRKPSSVENILSRVTWMANPYIIENYLSNNDPSNVEAPVFLLLITAELERSLGNVYLLKGKQVPSCMRDLLASAELREIFGETMMTTLQVIVGPPISLNIRNIVWHGFADSQEIPECGCFIVIILATLGKLLAMKDIKSNDISMRPSVQLHEQIKRLSGTLPSISPGNVSELVNIFHESPYIAHQMMPFYDSALNYFTVGKYLECTVIILPQLEHCLRRLFAAVNNCPERVLTAESDSLFTTLDEILAANLDDGCPNLLLKFLGDEMMVALLDIFVEPDGPRIRDRLSHGEVELQCVSETISSHLICLTAALASWTNQQKTITHNDHSFVSKIQAAIHQYKSVYHISTSVANEIIACCKLLLSCQNLVSNCGLQMNLLSSANVTIAKLGLFVGDQHEKNFTEALEPFGNLEFLEQIVGGLSLKTLYRPRKEMEILARLNRICRALSSTLKNMIDFILSKKPMLDMHQLRSRQRETFQRMLNSFPTISTSCRLVILISCRQLIHANDTESCSEARVNVDKKFLKNVETFTDNLSTMTDVTKNRWDEGCKLSEKFAEQSRTHFQSYS